MEKYSILVVEDEAIISLGIQEELEMLGYEIAGAAYRGDEALRLAESRHPDLALMDINLRGKLDGIETALQLQNIGRIPIVFLTGAVDNESIQRSKSVAPYGYILKPFGIKELQITLEHAINKFQLEEKARQSEARYRELFETSLDGILSTDLQGNILDSNPALQKFLGYSAEEMQKLKIIHFFPPDYALEEHKIIQYQVLERGYSDEILRDYLHKNGSRLPARVQIRLRKNVAGQPVGFWAVVRDVSLLTAAEQKIFRQASFSQQLINLTTLLNAQLDLSKVLEIICFEITQALDVDAAHVALFDPEKGVLALAHAYGPLDPNELIQIPYSKQIYDRFFAHNEAYRIIPDVQKVLNQHPYYNFMVKHDIRTALSVNLNRDSQLIGTLELATIGRTRQFNEEELTFIVACANHAAIAIGHARLYQQAKRRTEELELLGRLSSTLRLASSRQEMLPILLREAIELTRADTGVIYLLEQAGNPIDMLQFPTANDPAAEWFSPGGDRWAEALTTNEIVIDRIPDDSADHREGVDQRLLFIRSQIVIPFRSANTLTAILALGFTTSKIVEELNRGVLSSLAEMGGNALHRSGLMEMLEKRVTDRNNELATLYDLTVFVNRPLELDQILNGALQKIIGTNDASCGLIFRYEPASSLLRLKTQINLPVEMLPSVDPLILPEAINSWLKNSSIPWLAHKKNAQPSIPFVMPGSADFETVFNLPIRFEGTALGLLTLLWRKECDLKPENIALLIAVAERLGSSIQNDLLRKSSENAAILEERQRLARELHDSVTQSLYSLTLLAEAGKDLLAQQNLPRLAKCLEDLEINSVQALKEMRMLLFEMRPPQIEKQDFVKALQDRLEAVERRAGVNAVLEVEERLKLEPSLQDELFRIASEALNNSLKHSGASSVRIRLQSLTEGIQMVIEDEGRGFDPQINQTGGMGLRTMRERVDRLGGKLEIWSAPQAGTRVTIFLQSPGG
ncbi:MAG: PAS domain S-box protein [Anaerolineaceae bacterium]|nr:PAS domain S-box protein [Anaerolineaceae bacterium]